MDPLKYLTGYPADTQARVRTLIEGGRLGTHVRDRYGEVHDVRNDKALQQYVLAMKERHMRMAGPLHKVVYDDKLQVVRHALGTHTTVSRVQGGKLKASREIRIASLFRAAPAPFLRMIVAHELAHMKQPDHDKPFYQLCTHMVGDYHQLEFDLRLYLTLLDLERGVPVAGTPPTPQSLPAD